LRTLERANPPVTHPVSGRELQLPRRDYRIDDGISRKV
jgi:hypothetical protein